MPAKDDSRARERERKSAALVAAGVEITAGCLNALAPRTQRPAHGVVQARGEKIHSLEDFPSKSFEPRLPGAETQRVKIQLYGAQKTSHTDQGFSPEQIARAWEKKGRQKVR